MKPSSKKSSGHLGTSSYNWSQSYNNTGFYYPGSSSLRLGAGGVTFGGTPSSGFYIENDKIFYTGDGVSRLVDDKFNKVFVNHCRLKKGQLLRLWFFQSPVHWSKDLVKEYGEIRSFGDYDKVMFDTFEVVYLKERILNFGDGRFQRYLNCLFSNGLIYDVDIQEDRMFRSPGIEVIKSK